MKAAWYEKQGPAREFSPSAICPTPLRAPVNFAFASPPRESTQATASFQLQRRDQRMRQTRAESFNRLGWTHLSS